MKVTPLAIEGTGLVTAVGLSTPASCAAVRAKISNPTETRFIGSDGEWIMAHQVILDKPWGGLTKLVKMAAMAIGEALHDVPRADWGALPLLLCVAEKERPGRLEGLGDRLFSQIQEELGVRFAPASSIVPHGRVGVSVALAQARQLIAAGKAQRVVVAATDTLLTWPTLDHFQKGDRLLNGLNSNGFIPGEGAGALRVAPPNNRQGQLVCTGIGFGKEAAHIDADMPLRADGLVQAIKAALAEAGRAMHDFDYRITDLSGEHYYFKEAALALSRTLRQSKESFDIWHPAECTGEVGATSGVVILAAAQTACAKRYSEGPRILAHMANDAGQRAALTLEFREAA
jgi:3-oxoacyl-[acyl-carrier-protein] synthase-1